MLSAYGSAAELTILLLEDSGPMAWAIKDALAEDRRFIYLGVAVDRAQAEKLVLDHAPNLILVDLKLPVPGAAQRAWGPEESVDEGLNAVKRFRDLSPSSRIVALSAYFVEQPELVAQALKAGANAVIAKQAAPSERASWGEWFRRELIEISLDQWRMDPVVSRLVLRHEVSRPRDQVADLDSLTERELEVLRLLADGLEDKEIAAQLHIVPATVRVHVNNILSKLHSRNRTQAVVAALRAGLKTGPLGSSQSGAS
jgi:DNA-binding NarL/FixJ family response regulator